MRRSNLVKRMLVNKMSLKLCSLVAAKPCPWEIQNHSRDCSELDTNKHKKPQNAVLKTFATRYKQHKFLHAKLDTARWCPYSFEWYKSYKILPSFPLSLTGCFKGNFEASTFGKGLRFAWNGHNLGDFGQFLLQIYCFEVRFRLVLDNMLLSSLAHVFYR
jgi:hypothetical protein